MADAQINVIDGRAVVTPFGSELLTPIVAQASAQADRADQAADAAEAFRDLAEDEADASALSATQADTTLATFLSAAAGVQVFLTKAAANAGLAGVGANTFVLVAIDETAASQRTLYQKVSGAYVFVRVLGDATLDGLAESRGITGQLRYWLAACAEVNVRDMGNIFGNATPLLPRAFTASQSGTTVTASTNAFEKGDEGRLIIFADGNEALIRTVNTTDPTLVNTCTVAQSQSVSSQTARVQAKGPVLVHQGDSISYEVFIRVLKQLFRAYGFGGYFSTPLGDQTQSRIMGAGLSGGATSVLGTNYAVHPQGAYWSIPGGGTCDFQVNSALYPGNGTVGQPAFDLMPENTRTDTALVVWERAAGSITIQRRRPWEKEWETVETIADTSAGSGTYAWKRYKHALDNWVYRVLGVSGTVKLIGVGFWNRTTPGFSAWSLSRGSTVVTDANTMTSATLKELTDLVHPDLRTYLYADYGQVIAAGQTMAQALAATAALWDAAAPRTDTLWMGMWNDSGVQAPLDRDAVRLHALGRGEAYIGFKDIFKDYATAGGAGLMRDTVHQTKKGMGVTSHVFERIAGLLEGPLANESRNVLAREGRFNELWQRDRPILSDMRKGRAQAGPKDRGAYALSGQCYFMGTMGAALGTADFTFAAKIRIPAVSDNVDLVLIGTGTANSNNAGHFTIQIQGGSLRFGLRNAANSSTYSYKMDFLGQAYAGLIGWLYVRSNRARNGFEVWFDTERVTENIGAIGEFAPGTATETFLTGWTGLGTNIVWPTPASIVQPFYGLAVWNVALTDTEIVENVLADSYTTTQPSVFYDFSEGAGRVVIDKSGNKRHGRFRSAGGNELVVGTGPVWLPAPRRRGLAPVLIASGLAAAKALPNEEIVSDHSSLQTITLPDVAEAGDRLRIVGKGAGKWKIGQPAAHQVVEGAGSTIGTNATTAGTGGSITAGNRYDSIELECVVSDSVTPSYVWTVVQRHGGPTWV